VPIATLHTTFLQYPAGTPEVSLAISDSSGITVFGSPLASAQDGYKRSAFIGSCKHQVWKAIRASSAAPYYLDDFSDGISPSSCLSEYILYPFYNLLIPYIGLLNFILVCNKRNF